MYYMEIYIWYVEYFDIIMCLCIVDGDVRVCWVYYMCWYNIRNLFYICDLGVKYYILLIL